MHIHALSQIILNMSKDMEKSKIIFGGIIMIKKILILILLISLSGCTTLTNAISSTVYIKGNALVNEKLNMEDFFIQVYNQETNESIVNSYLDNYGEFELSIEEDGNYIMTALNANGEDYKSNIISFSISDNELTSKVDFNLIITDELVESTSSISINSPISIEGTVNYPNGMNYVDIKVMLASKIGGKALKVFMVDKIGEFKISDIQDGTYYLCAQGPNNKTSEWIKATVKNSKIVEEEKIVLELK